MTRTCCVLAIALAIARAPAAAQHDAQHDAAQHDLLRHRGNLAMGFDQDKTTHHFLLSPTGGAIDVRANDPADAASIAQIRAHLREIEAAFGRGLFEAPVATHGTLPPGAAIMAANTRLITYRYEEREGGGALKIDTADAATLAAIHDFLRYQITEHRTGDPLALSDNGSAFGRPRASRRT